MKKIIIISITAIICSAIIGFSFYAIQIKKQDSIERQQQIELQAKSEANQAQQEAEQERVKKEQADTTFSNNLKCQALLKDLKSRWGNVVGIYYDEWQNTCIVKYIENGEIEESPVENMQDN